MLGHYLPQMYLGRFTSQKRLHVFDRTTGKLRRDSTRNVAAITDYYLLTTPAGERDASVEHEFLSTIEGAATPALMRLAHGEPISDEEHEVVATFIALLCTRVPAFEAAYVQMHDYLGQPTFRYLAGTPERAARFLERRRQSFPYSPEEFSARVNSDSLAFPASQRERIGLMMELAEPLVAGFKSMDWFLLRTRGKRRFITSDGPIGFLPLPAALATYGELSPNVLRFFALCPEVCLMLADRQGEQPCLIAKVVEDNDVAKANAAIALAAIRLLISRDRDELEKVLEETDLRDSTFTPTSTIVEWDDDDEGRFGLSVRIHHNTEFPIELPVDWTCRSCQHVSVETFVVSADRVPKRPQGYSEWLDCPCINCGSTPRQTRSWLGEERVDLTPPVDE